MIPRTGFPNVDRALTELYNQVLKIEERTGEGGLAAKQNYEGDAGLVRIIRTATGGYALHARSEDGWLTSTNVSFSFRDRTELARDVTSDPPAAHASSHEAGGSDEITITNLTFPGGSYYLKQDGTWDDPIAGGGIVSLQGDTGSAQTGSAQTLSGTSDTNVTIAVASGGVANDHMFTIGWSGQLSVGRGGTGNASLTGLLQGNGASAFTAITDSSTAGQVLRVTGASTYAWGALDLANANAVTGTLPAGNLATHDIITAHTESGLTTGQIIRATGATTFAWGQLDLSNANAITGTLGSSYIGTHSHAESDITDGTTLTRNAGTETVTGTWTISTGGSIKVTQQSDGLWYWDNGLNYHTKFITVGDWTGSHTVTIPQATGTLALTSDIPSVITDHGALSGLGDDDHSAIYPGYAQSETISGDWVFAGSTYKGITVGSSANMGVVRFNTSGTNQQTVTPSTEPAATFYLPSSTYTGGTFAVTSQLGNETITLSGDVAGSGTTSITTTIQALAVETGMIAANAVALTKFVQAPAQYRVVGRITSGAGDYEHLEPNDLMEVLKQATTVLDVNSGGTGAATLTGYVYGNGTGAFTASTTIPESAISDSTVLTRNAGTETITGAWTVTTGSLAVYDNTLRVYDGNANFYRTLDVPADWSGASNGTMVYPDVASGSTFITTGNLSSITTVGTITAGAWQSSTVIDAAYLDAQLAEKDQAESITGHWTFNDSTYHGISVGVAVTTEGQVRFHSPGATGALYPASLAASTNWILPSTGATSTIITTGNLSSITSTGTLTSVASSGDIYTTGMTDYFSSSTKVGWSSYTTSQLYYKKIGKMMFVWVMIEGTSDSTSASFTLPYAANAGCGSNVIHAQIRNASGSATTGAIVITASSATINCYINMTGSAWTASGTKRVCGQFFYETT